MANRKRSLLARWKAENGDMEECVKITQVPREAQNSPQKKKQINILGELTHFYHYTVIPNKPERPCFPPVQKHILSSAAFLAHIHFFLQEKLFEARWSIYDSAVKRVHDLIDSLVEISKSTKFDIEIDQMKLLWQVFADSKESHMISTVDNSIVTQISQLTFLLGEDATFSLPISKIIKKMAASADHVSSIFLEDYNQELFESVFFDPLFPCCKDIELLLDSKVMTTPKMYTKNVISLLNSSANALNISEKSEVFAYSLSLFRAIFSSAFVINPDFFIKPKPSKFRLIQEKLTLAQIGAPMKLLPGSKDNDISLQVSLKIPLILEAASFLTLASFVLSPLDILAYIHKALVVLKSYARSIAGEEVATAFESIFGLFMLSIIASDLPSPEQTFLFISEFSPQRGLAGNLEYARATATAASIHCDALYKLYGS